LKASGRLGGSPLASAAPLAWEISEAGGAASGSLSLLGGSLTGDIRLDRDARLDLAWSGVDLERLALLSLANPVNGEASGALQFRNPRDGEPSGALRLEVTGLNPQGLQLNPVNLAVDATLAGREMTATALGSGQGFALAAEGRARADIGSGFDVRLALEEPASGDLRIDGRIDSLWGLFGPPGQVLRGAVSSRVALRGSLAAPNLSGGFDLRDGGFEHAETGLLLRDIRLEGVFDQTALTLNGLSARDRTAGALTGGGKLAWSGGLSGDLRFAMKSLRVLSGEDREAVVSGDVRLVVQGRSSRAAGDLLVEQARFSIEQPAVERIPVLPSVRRVGFEAPAARRSATDAWPPLALDFAIRAPRRVVVFGRGLDTEWGGEVRLSGTTARPLLSGTAQLARGDLNLAGRRFAFEDGAVRFEGSPASTRIDISARRRAADLDARASVSGQLSDLTFDLSSTPALPRDEVLSRVLFSRSLAQLTPLEGAQLTAALNKLAGGQAAFDPAELLRNAVGLDRIALGSGADATAVSAGKYITRDVYLEVGAGGEGGVAADVEWQPSEGVSIISSARGNGDTRMAVRWKRDY
jgi:translocation and assembly module TamB